MFKLLFLSILFLNLSLAYGPSLLQGLKRVPKPIRFIGATIWKRRSSPTDLSEKPPSTVEIPDRGSDEDHCLLPTDNQRCTGTASPIIVPILMEQSPVRCGPAGEGEMYTFAYQHGNADGGVEEYIVYNFCYDHKNKETIYTQHEMRWPKLLLNENLREEGEMPFEMSTRDYGYFEDYFEAMEQTYSESENTNKAQQLVSPGDFVFALQKITTFHYANVRPLRQDLIKLWDHIGELIRNGEAAKHNVRHLFFTGAFRLIEDTSTIEYIENSNIPIPELWIKMIMIKDSTKKRFGLAILIENHPTNDSQVKLNKYCAEDFCNIINRKDQVFESFIDVGSSLRCCLITNEILTFFNLDQKYKAEDINFLPVDGLIDSQYLLDRKRNIS